MADNRECWEMSKLGQRREMIFILDILTLKCQECIEGDVSKWMGGNMGLDRRRKCVLRQTETRQCTEWQLKPWI